MSSKPRQLSSFYHQTKIKLNLEYSDITLVLEKDGTEVDDDESLSFLKDKTFIVLGPGQNWTKDQVPVGQSEPVPCDPHTDAAVAPSVSESVVAAISRTVPVSKTDVPRFSDHVTAKLRAGECHVVWNKMIQEAANHYLAHFPSIGIDNSSSDYRDVGQKMIQSYPSVSREGTNPWSFFTSALSQKIRRIRWDNKRKSQPAENTVNTPQRSPKRFRIESTDTGDVESYEEHVKELQVEMGKKNIDATHVKTLQKSTFKQRRVWIAQLPAGDVNTVLEKFPCFKEARYILYDFKMILMTGNLVSVAGRFELVFETALKFMKKASSATNVDILKFIESETGFKHGKGQKTKSVLQEVVLTESVKLERLLTSPAKSPPKLCAINKENQLVNLAIVADGVYILLDTSEVIEALLALLAFYYIMDLEYPRCYSQILGLMQHVGLQQPICMFSF